MTVTAVTVLGDSAIGISSPSVLSVLVPTNGWVIRVTTDSTDTSPDPSKLRLSVRSNGHDTNGTPTDVYRNLTGVAHLRRPYNEASSFSPGTTGIYDVVISDEIFAPDDSIDIQFDAGFTSGSTSQSWTGTVGRLDSSPYPIPIVRHGNAPYNRVSSANDYVGRYSVISRFARNNTQVARVESYFKQGATSGPTSGIGTMSRSIWTPVGDTHPGSIPAQEYAVPMSAAGLADGSMDEYFIVYPWIGNVYRSDTEASCFAWPTLKTCQAFPQIRDYADKHTSIYAFVNSDGSAGGSAAIQTSLTDPGAAASYADPNAAAIAIEAWNANTANRGAGFTHNDMSGGVIVFREISGSTRGTNADTYAIRNSMSGRTMGLLPIEFRSLSGVASDQVRLRGLKPDGSATSSKIIPLRTRWRGLTFDGTGTSGAANTILDGSGSSIPNTPFTSANVATIEQINCKAFSNSSAGTSNTIIFRAGIRFLFNFFHDTPTGAGDVGNNPAAYIGIYSCVGSEFTRTTQLAAAACIGLANGVRLTNVRLSTTDNGGVLANNWDQNIWYNVRSDHLNPTANQVSIGMSRPIYWGVGVCNLLIRKCGSNSSPLMSIGADGALYEYKNIVLQHIGGFGQRINVNYNDQGWLALVKRLTMFGCSFHNYNTKRDTFPAGETPVDTNHGVVNTTVIWYKGAIVYDAANPTISSITLSGSTATVTTSAAHGLTTGDIVRLLGQTSTAFEGTYSITVTSATTFTYTRASTPTGAASVVGTYWSKLNTFYQAIQDVPAGTAVSNAAYWESQGTNKFNTSFGAQSRRVGNWFSTYGVGSFGNFASVTANGDTVSSPTSWFGERFPGVINSPYSTWVVNDSSALGTNLWADQGDFKPKVGSPMQNQVAAGFACTLFDLAGITRRNGGNGAAGPYEVLSQDIGPVAGPDGKATYAPTITLGALTPTIDLPLVVSAVIGTPLIEARYTGGRIFGLTLTMAPSYQTITAPAGPGVGVIYAPTLSQDTTPRVVTMPAGPVGAFIYTPILSGGVPPQLIGISGVDSSQAPTAPEFIRIPPPIPIVIGSAVGSPFVGNMGIWADAGTVTDYDTNPFPPYVPDEIRQISPVLHDYLSTQAATLRLRDNQSQAGSNAWSLAKMLEISDSPQYPLGSKGRFNDDTLGLLRGVYVKFVEMVGLAGAPVGFVLGEPWTVTNDFSFSNGARALGFLPGDSPSDDSFGWVITDGLNLTSVLLEPGLSFVAGEEFVWSSSGRVSYESDGIVLGRLIGDSLMPGQVLIGIGNRNGATKAAALGNAVNSITSELDGATATLDLIQQAFTDGVYATSSSVNNLTSQLGDLSASSTASFRVLTESDSSLAEQIASLRASLGASITAESQRLTQALVTQDAALATIKDSVAVNFGGALSAAASAKNVAIANVGRLSANAQQISGIESSLFDPATGLGATASALDTLTVEVHDSVTGLSATVSRVTTLEATLSGGTFVTTATFNSEHTARVSAEGAIASDVTTLFTTTSGHTATLVLYGTSINGIEAKWGVKLDVNGKIAGIELNDGTSGTSYFDVRADKVRFWDSGGTTSHVVFGVDTTLDEVTIEGRLVIDTGTYVLAQGKGFGTSNQFVQWFGPKMALNLMSESNGFFWLKNDGSAYYAGGFSAGTLTTKAGTSSTSGTAFAETAVFGSNGGTITVAISYAYNSTQNITYAPGSTTAWNAAKAAVSPAPTNDGSGYWSSGPNAYSSAVTVELYRSRNHVAYGSPVASWTISGDWEWNGETNNSVDPGYVNQIDNIAGSWTYTDPDLSTDDRQFKVVISSRAPTYTYLPQQNISVVCIEA